MNRHRKHPGERKDPVAIEADVAYFEARLAFAARGEQTAYKRAQRKACEALSRSLGERLEKLRRQG